MDRLDNTLRVSLPEMLSVPAEEVEAGFQRACRLASLLTGARRAALLVAAEEGQLRLMAVEGTRLRLGLPVGLGPCVAEEALRSRRPLLIGDLAGDSLSGRSEGGRPMPSCMAAPVLWKDDLYGVLCAAEPAPGRAFTSGDLAALQLLAEHLAALVRAVASASARGSVDGVTGVLTGQALDERLGMEVERSRRFGRPLSLALLGLDFPRRLTDRAGRRARDRILVQAARGLLGSLRRVDLVARHGTDEFAIVLPETSAPESLVAARRVVEGLRRVLSSSTEDAGGLPRLSVGVATLSQGSGPEEFLEQAFQSMLAARGDHEGVRHWDAGEGQDKMLPYLCVCGVCGRPFPVENSRQLRDRRFCSKLCAAEARRRLKRERNLAIMELREAGLTLRSIADRYGISEERVRQIWNSR